MITTPETRWRNGCPAHGVTVIETQAQIVLRDHTTTQSVNICRQNVRLLDFARPVNPIDSLHLIQKNCSEVKWQMRVASRAAELHVFVYIADSNGMAIAGNWLVWRRLTRLWRISRR